jgi:hypothetical protein
MASALRSTLSIDEGRPFRNPRTVPGARPVRAEAPGFASDAEGMAIDLANPGSMVGGSALEQTPDIRTA